MNKRNNFINYSYKLKFIFVLLFLGISFISYNLYAQSIRDLPSVNNEPFYYPKGLDGKSAPTNAGPAEEAASAAASGGGGGGGMPEEAGKGISSQKCKGVAPKVGAKIKPGTVGDKLVTYAPQGPASAGKFIEKKSAPKPVTPGKDFQSTKGEINDGPSEECCNKIGKGGVCAGSFGNAIESGAVGTNKGQTSN